MQNNIAHADLRGFLLDVIESQEAFNPDDLDMIEDEFCKSFTLDTPSMNFRFTDTDFLEFVAEVRWLVINKVMDQMDKLGHLVYGVGEDGELIRQLAPDRDPIALLHYFKMRDPSVFE